MNRLHLSLHLLTNLHLFLSFLSLLSLPNKSEILRANHPDAALAALGIHLAVPAYNFTLPDGPDVTVVLLNWSRLPNVILIASVLCMPELENLIARIFIWNNNPSYKLSLHVRK
jgi:hypothetical protein